MFPVDELAEDFARAGRILATAADSQRAADGPEGAAARVLADLRARHGDGQAAYRLVALERLFEWVAAHELELAERGLYWHEEDGPHLERGLFTHLLAQL